MRREPKYPRLTPLRAFALLRSLDRYYHELQPSSVRGAVDETRHALADHVKAAIVAGRRRRG